MPKIPYHCKSCNNKFSKYYFSPNKVLKEVDCECGEKAKRKLAGPTSDSKMYVDNGVQARQVEIYKNINEMVADRENAEKKQRGDSDLPNLK